MKRKCRILVCLIAAIMIVSALPFAVFAQDDAQIECGYVTNGLVSWYDASNHGTSDTVWEDLYGNNDITVVSDGTSGFTDDVYHLYNNFVQLPTGIDSTIRGEAFTVEFSLGDVNRTATYLSILGCTTSGGEDIGFWITSDTQLTFGTKAGRAIFKGDAVSEMVSDATLTITYDTVKKEETIYLNGVLLAKLSFTTSNPAVSKAAAALKLSLGHPEVGSDVDRRNQEVNYRSIRFYDRALNVNEIYANAHFDKMSAATNGYVTDGLVSHYDGVNRGTTDGVWEDLVGVNDITVEKGYSYSNNSALEFNDKGLYLKDTGVWLPDALRDLTLGDAFTMEFYVEDAALSGASWLGICTSAKADNSGESIALYILQENGTMALKFNGDNGQRPTTTQDLMPKLNRGALVSVTFDTVAQAAVIYINGIEMARKPVTTQALVSDAYGIALGTMTNGAADMRDGQELTYRSIRFYDRALNENEIKANAFVDGFMRYSPDTLPVMDGLVSWYDGGQHGTSDTVWEDLYGNNDITVVSDDTSYFINDGYRLYNNSVQLPAGIDSTIRGEAFTVEFLLGDVNRTATWTTFLGCTTTNKSEDIGFWITYDSDLYFRTKGGEARFTGSAVSKMVSDTMLTITYDTVKQELAIYMDGTLLAKNSISAVPAVSKAADALKLSLGHPEVGSVAKRRNQEVNYRSIRFYNRALSESEIKANAFYEGFGHHITVDQPATNIVGDVAMTREINSAGELAAMMAADKLPAAAIYRIDKNMQVLDDNGVGFASLLGVIRSTESKVLPVVVPADQDTVSALADWIVECDFYDISILTKDPTLLKAARAKMPVLRGALDLTDVYKDRSELTKEDLIDIRKIANTNSATVVRLPAALATKDNVQYLYNRQINVWVGISDTPTTVEKYNALLSGAVGVISDDTAGLLDIACSLPVNTMTRSPLNGGHRGLPSKAPECTIEGSMLAYQLGANYIEMDVRLSLDKEVVVIHDGTTNRTCDQNYSITSTNYWGVLEHVKANKGFENDPLFKDCKLSLLGDFFKAFQDIDDCLLVVEIKSEDPAIVSLIKELTEEYGVYDRVFVITFFNNIMEEMRETWPEMSVGALIDPGPLEENDADKTAVDTMKMFGGVSTSYDPATGSLASNASRATLLRGFQINSWYATTANLPLRFVSGMASVCHNYADQMGSAIQSFAANVPEKLLLGKSAALSMDLLTYANVDTGDLINTKDVTVTVLEGADLVTVNGNTLTASGLGTVTFIMQYTYKYANGSDVQTVSLCTQPITLTVAEGSPIENAIADAKYAKDGVVVADRACEAGADNKYVSAAQMQALNDAIAAAEAAKETATTDEQINAVVKALTDALAIFNEAIQTGDTHRGEATDSTECKYGCGTTAVAYVLDAEGNPVEGFYPTLQNAIDATPEGGTVMLLGNVTLDESVFVSKSVTIDGTANKYLITMPSDIVGDLFDFDENAGFNFGLQNLHIKKLSSGNYVIGNGYNSNTCNVDISNCTIESYGGIVYFSRYTNGLAQITNSELIAIGGYALHTYRSSMVFEITNTTLTSGNGTCVIAIEGYSSGRSESIKLNLRAGAVIDTSLIERLYVDENGDPIYTASARAIYSYKYNKPVVTLYDDASLIAGIGFEIQYEGYGSIAFDASYTGAIVRQSGLKYYFFTDVKEAVDSAVDGDVIFTYNATIAAAIRAAGYIVTEADGVYTVTGKFDFTAIDGALANANSAKENIVATDKACVAGAGNKYVTAAEMQALLDAIAAANEAKANAKNNDELAAAVTALNDAVATFTVAIKDGADHDGEYDCSTICKYCGEATITDAVAHAGEFACSITCKYCGEETVTDAVAHDGEFECSTTCKYGCGTIIEDAVAHKDEDNNHNCDFCDKKLSDCADNDNNHKCDVCDEELSQCADVNNDHKCDVCGKELSQCADTNNDHKCDVCGEKLSDCADNNSDHNCDVCGTKLSECTDNNKDHKCDTCGVTKLNDHTGGNATCKTQATCSVCGELYGVLAQHKDENPKDHECDYGCGKNDMGGACADSDTDTDHVCDYCGVTELNDHTGGSATCTTKAQCAVCGKAYGELAQHTYDGDTDASCNLCGAERTVENNTNSDDTNTNENNANTNENNAASNNGDAPAKKGLSGGAIAGIVIGVIAVIGACATAIVAGKKNKQKHK